MWHTESYRYSYRYSVCIKYVNPLLIIPRVHIIPLHHTAFQRQEILEPIY